MGDLDSFFDDALPAIAQGAVAAGDGDDDWFDRAADGTPAVDERATAAREAIGAAALSIDRELARRAPRRARWRRNASTKPERGGRRPRGPGRRGGVGVLALLVVLSLALVTGSPQTRDGGERSARASSATIDRALNNRGVAVARQRRRAAAARRAHQRARRQSARARARRTTHRRRRSRPVARRPAAPAPVPSVAAAPAAPVVVRPAAAPVRRVAPRALRSPDPSFTPGDLPPASEAP